jgi:hypothetical protein
MLVPEILKRSAAETDGAIKLAQTRVDQARKELGSQEEYLRSLLAEKELVQRAIAILEKVPNA